MRRTQSRFVAIGASAVAIAGFVGPPKPPALASSPVIPARADVPGASTQDGGSSAPGRPTNIIEFAGIGSVSCAAVLNCAAVGGYTGTASSGAILENETNGVWGKAMLVPVLSIESVSCASAGNCSAGGSYSETWGPEAFVVSEAKGVWGKPEEVPGIATLNTRYDAAITSVSCASAGNCSAGGDYSNKAGEEAFVVNETNGIWGKAEEVPGTATLNTKAAAAVSSVSCTSAGNCSAGGGFRNSAGAGAFVVNETKGTWGKAEVVPGLAALHSVGASVISVSCAAYTGTCSAGGYYYDGSIQGPAISRAFVVGETKGTWGKAEELPGLGANSGNSGIDSLSCAAVDYCSAGGALAASAFVANRTNGTWLTLAKVPGTTTHIGSGVNSVSCRSAGNCTAGGFFDSYQAFVVNETNGVWGRVEEVPGTATLNAGGLAQVTSVSCASAGNCSAGGMYSDASKHNRAFVVTETKGTWGKAEEVPGTG